MNIEKILESWKKYRIGTQIKSLKDSSENPDLFDLIRMGNKTTDRRSVHDNNIFDRTGKLPRKKIGDEAFHKEILKNAIRGQMKLGMKPSSDINAISQGTRAFNLSRDAAYAQQSPDTNSNQRLLNVLRNRLSKK
jgi:hypothetical protein